MSLQHIEMQLLEFGLLLLAAYIGGKLTQKLGMGEIVGQISGGVLVSPSSLEFLVTQLLRLGTFQSENGLIPIYRLRTVQFPEYTRILEGYLFFVFLLLGMLAFSLGEELHKERLRYIHTDSLLIGLAQSLLTFLLLGVGFRYIFAFPVIHALLIASIGMASAPVVTFALLKRLNIEGALRDMLSNTILLADLLEIVSFAVLLAIAAVMQHDGTASPLHLVPEISKELLLAVALGLCIFFGLKFSLKPSQLLEEARDEKTSFLSTILSDRPTPSVEILAVVMGVLALGIGVGIHFRLPFLISAVLAGTLIANFHSHEIFDSLRIDNITPLFNLFFFALIGSMLRVKDFSRETLFYIIGFLLLRGIGKMLGTWGGCRLTGQDPKMTACLPKLVLPQAGMAAVETMLAATVLGEPEGILIFHTVIPALVIFELLGAWLSEKTLRKWREWTIGEREALLGPQRDQHALTLSDLLADRVFEITATTKEGAISQLAQYCASTGIVTHGEAVSNLIWEREQLGSTGIGDGIALPHFRTKLVEHTRIVCGLMQTPIPWGAPDLQPVEIAFLLVTPEHSPEQHLQAIRTIGMARQQADFIQKLKQGLAQNTLQNDLQHRSISAFSGVKTEERDPSTPQTSASRS